MKAHTKEIAQSIINKYGYCNVECLVAENDFGDCHTEKIVKLDNSNFDELANIENQYYSYLIKTPDGNNY